MKKFQRIATHSEQQDSLTVQLLEDLSVFSGLNVSCICIEHTFIDRTRPYFFHFAPTNITVLNVQNSRINLKSTLFFSIYTMQRILHHFNAKAHSYCVYVCVFAGIYQHFCFLSFSPSLSRTCVHLFICENTCISVEIFYSFLAATFLVKHSFFFPYKERKSARARERRR